MRKRILFFIILGAAFMSNISAQSQCPGCQVEVPNTLPADTIYLSDAPNGRAGQPYNGDLSFRMPKTTTPVAANDPTVIPGLNISEITIVSVTNLPPGLTWQPSRTNFKTSEITDGCVKFCGTPLQPGLYDVEVVVRAQVLLVSQTTSFSFPILIEPAISITEGFTMENASGCGEVTAQFKNNVPSGGRNGFSYFWDFGNGRTTRDENPGSQTYTTPGIYDVKYQAIIDTAGYTLTNVRIEKVGCGDIFGGKPDLKIEIFAPDSTLLFKSGVTNNANLPLDYNLNLPIGNGNYRLRVLDEDDGLFGKSDELCGIITFNRLSNGRLATTDMTVNLTIFHPVDTVRSSGKVTVFKRPETPAVTGYNGEALCKGDVVTLASSYNTNVQWYRNQEPIIENGDKPRLEVRDDGVYQVWYTSEDGCQAASSPLRLDFSPLPAAPVFVNDNNTLRLFDEQALPRNFSARWWFNGNTLPEATNKTSICASASGLYELEIVDSATGCLSRFSRPVTFDPTFAGCRTTSAEDRFQELAAEVRIFPNPTDGQLLLRVELRQAVALALTMRNTIGAMIYHREYSDTTGQSQFELDIREQPAGIYLLEVTLNGQSKHFKIAKQ